MRWMRAMASWLVPEAAAPSARPLDLRHLISRSRRANAARIRALCRTVYLGGDLALCRVLGRYKMYVDTRDASVSAHLVMDGYWELWVTEEMVRRIRPGMTAIDVGANLGYFTLLMADLVGPAGRVLAFDPNPGMIERLRLSIAINGFAGRASAYEVGLGEAEGEAKLLADREYPGGGQLVAMADDRSACTVPVRRLDQFDAALDADFVKIDVEGGEQAVWRGMTTLRERNRPLTVFLEFSTGRYGDPAAFLDEIAAGGFSLHRIDVRRGIVPATRAEILALPPEDEAMLVLSR